MDDCGFAEAMETGLSRAKDEDRQKLVSALSHCSAVLDLPPEAVIQLLKIKAQDLWKLQSALRVAETLSLSQAEMSEVLDLARVARIMEEEQEPSMGSPGVTGATGPTGPIGARGVTGLNARIMGSPKNPKFTPPPWKASNQGPIRGPQR